MKKLTYCIAFLVIICLLSCKKDDNTKPVPQPVKSEINSHPAAYNYQKAITVKRTLNTH
ncbi:hypothetical protein [Pedobacter sp. L105]|uniref:hypothetical protein n=1 Tax=Pedobacter sp. L105 TaxID=1641871 RepID=UPI00131CB381|nr:hypothetical protein [Pedobacter sp. L105]